MGAQLEAIRTSIVSCPCYPGYQHCGLSLISEITGFKMFTAEMQYHYARSVPAAQPYPLSGCGEDVALTEEQFAKCA